ncbi:MAG: carbohydrate ABC transporter permease, partial [Candidatus Thermoplasmatota archaeon]|nr:carbohydrate ABC transporter permease [Candidatus Thermoplasmatota archaeon]
MKSHLSNIPLYLAVVVILLFTYFPLYVLFLIAFTPSTSTVAAVYPSLYPAGLTSENLVDAFQIPQITQALYKSLEVAFMVGGIALLIGIPAAYGLSRIKPGLANLISSTLFLANMMPAVTIAIPISVTFLSIGLNETPVALALAQELVVLPLTVFMLLGSFQSLPRDIINQARVDGCGLLSAVYTVIVPLAKSGVAAAFILSWMVSWDEFTFAVFLSPIHPTLPILIYIYITRGYILDAAVT